MQQGEGQTEVERGLYIWESDGGVGASSNEDAVEDDDKKLEYEYVKAHATVIIRIWSSYQY